MNLAYSAPTASPEHTRFLLSRFAEIGYDGLQLKKGQYAGYREEPGRFKREWGAVPGVASALICGLDVRSETSRGDLGKTVAFAGAAGSELVVVCLGGPRAGMSGRDIAQVAAAVAELGREASDAGVNLTVHNHYDSPLMHRDDFDIFYGACPEGTVGLTLDTAHAFKSGIRDVAEIVRSFAPLIDNFHLKDFAAGDSRVLGQGEIDFAPIFAAIKAVGYDGWVSTDEESGADLKQAMAHCLAFMKGALAG